MALSWSLAQKTWIQISYEINKLEIIQKFCINKEKTTFKCDGKCYLKEQILEVDEDEDIPYQNVETEQKIQLFLVLVYNLDITALSDEVLNFSKHQSLILYQFTNSIFRPPEYN